MIENLLWSTLLFLIFIFLVNTHQRLWTNTQYQQKKWAITYENRKFL